MEQPMGNDLRMNGAGTASGGAYRDVQVNGAGTITGDITCDSLTGNGALSVLGAVRARRVEANGSADIRGGLHAEAAKFSGAGKLGGDAEVRDLRGSGSLKVGGAVKAEQVEIRGAGDIGGDCTAETFSAVGAIRVGGLLNAGRVDIELHGNSSARAVGGETIRVVAGRDVLGIGKFFQKLIGHEPAFTAESVEGDDVRLEHARVQTVRARRVEIGPGCEIGLVEYTDTLERAPDAMVREVRQG